MSDDGYFYDDEVDDFEGDLFWNDDGEINLADDLAEHTLHSPVYVEDPANDAMDGYSDWEYYSDDYYDDDPVLLKEDRQAPCCPVRKSERQKANGLQRGKKRKLAVTSDIPSLSLDPESNDKLTAMQPWFKGTVWRSSSPSQKEEELYRPGMGDRVALFADGREIFTSSRPYTTDRKEDPERSGISDQTTGETAITSPRTGSKTCLNERANGATEFVELDDDDIAGPKGRKRRRVASAKDAQQTSNHKVVGIPLRRVSDTGETEPPKPHKMEHQHPSRRKRKASEAEDEIKGAEQITAQSQSIASEGPPRKVQNREKTTSPITRSRRSGRSKTKSK